ncbi:hypothetical protein ACQGSH_29475, partial [Bacillus wiedmannii]|uniref:hypothetical protein n=1 Tax=Bacillus wiedmannii TaxID=1890302 RepID=UPI003CF0DFDB
TGRSFTTLKSLNNSLPPAIIFAYLFLSQKVHYICIFYKGRYGLIKWNFNQWAVYRPLIIIPHEPGVLLPVTK